ncbi:MAG: peptidylprolyl isomerase [Epulopiscium sp. Nele67-Bin005]|nr:MAG: peptidylprolyl isomerase [Epulopiscium sp. Nele67-Bin005]
MKNLKKHTKLLLIILGLNSFLLTGCSDDDVAIENPPANDTQKASVQSENNPIATIVIKDFGEMEAELYPDIAPNTVANFIELANSNFYDGLIIHRVDQDFVIQGGDPNGVGTGGPGYRIVGEFATNGYTQNTLSHDVGVLSMARSSNNDSAGSQFFIVTGEASFLDGAYAGFGKVISGENIYKLINDVEVDISDKPLNDVVIESISVDTKGIQYQVEKLMD